MYRAVIKCVGLVPDAPMRWVQTLFCVCWTGGGGV